VPLIYLLALSWGSEGTQTRPRYRNLRVPDVVFPILNSRRRLPLSTQPEPGRQFYFRAGGGGFKLSSFCREERVKQWTILYCTLEFKASSSQKKPLWCNHGGHSSEIARRQMFRWERAPRLFANGALSSADAQLCRRLYLLTVERGFRFVCKAFIFPLIFIFGGHIYVLAYFSSTQTDWYVTF